MAPHLLPGTDLIFTISRHFAEHYARVLPLKVVPCPIQFPRMQFYQIWHSRNHKSAAQHWMRGILKQVADRLFASTTPSTLALAGKTTP
jgi:DNA-binding transcriptional LysR family regulator